MANAVGLLEAQEKERSSLEQINNPDTKWVLEEFKLVLDRQSLTGTGPLPDSLGNLAHGRFRASLDTYCNNLCLWRCIVVHHEVLRPGRSTEGTHSLARGHH